MSYQSYKLCSLVFGIVVSLVGANPCVADEGERVVLWPQGAPEAGGDQQGDVPDLTIYQAKSDTPTAAVVVLPGGGYGGLASSYEGHDVAKWLQEHGVTGGVCMYRHRGKGNAGKGYQHPHPMLDAQRAIRLLRAQSKQWNIDPKRIGILGFSAGGHLASTCATHFDDGDASATDDPIAQTGCRPDFAILCYAVVGMDKPYAHRGSQRNLLGDDPKPELLQSLSNETQVSPQTPPTFLFHTSEDTVVSAENAVQFYLSCLKHKVPVELHAFETGRHGVGLARDIPGTRQWPQLCLQWMVGRGIIVGSD